MCDYLMVHGEDNVEGVNMNDPRIAIQDEDPTEKISEGMLGPIQSGVFASNDVEENMTDI